MEIRNNSYAPQLLEAAQRALKVHTDRFDCYRAESRRVEDKAELTYKVNPEQAEALEMKQDILLNACEVEIVKMTKLQEIILQMYGIIS